MTLHIRFVTYFPHVDNIYSHRSTQRYKRKPFVSHYWDCRLKGRPPGTPKSDDPNKRKRKRQARERDLCDVKIKITEYFPGARGVLGQEANGVTGDAGDNFFAQGEHFGATLENPQEPLPFGLIKHTNENLPVPGSNGERFFTIQRVNGNGGNGKGDGVAGPHKHSLADSDRVKKNSIQRQLLKEEKEMKKLQVRYEFWRIFCLVICLVHRASSFKQRHICPLSERHSLDCIMSTVNSDGRRVVFTYKPNTSPFLVGSLSLYLHPNSTSCSYGNTSHT